MTNALHDAEFLSLVPAGGKGERLGVLTAERAKPALATSFDNEGNIQRMIDIPLEAIRSIGGAALVTTLFAAETLDFVDTYPHVVTKHESHTGSPIDSLISELELLESSQASLVSIIPGDAYIDAVTLDEMQVGLEKSPANVLILASHHLEGHKVWGVNEHGILTGAAHQVDVVADLGVHLFKKDWLVERLHYCLAEYKTISLDIWEHLYNINKPVTDILLYIPKNDPVAIDMGTASALYRTVTQLNIGRVDSSGNIVFPEAILPHHSTATIALPSSSAAFPLERAIIPEACRVVEEKQALLVV